MTSIDELDDQALLDLSQRTDPLGVVSVYVNADPNNREAMAIDIKNRYRELQRRISADSSDRAQQVVASLARLEPELASLTDPTGAGRGRILFAALDNEWRMRLISQMSVPNRVVLDDGPFIHPLLELLDEGRPTGVVLVAGDYVRVLEWRLGRLTPVTQLDQEEIEAPHERAGQRGGGPPGQFHTPMQEHRQARQRDRTHRFLDRVAEATSDMARERRWERILISGGERWTEVVANKLPQSLAPMIIRDTRVLSGLEEANLLATVTERIHEHHAAQERQLVERVREAGHGQAGALGLSEVVSALNAGQVAHLVYDPEVRYQGALGKDGSLYAADELGPDGEQPVPEPRLTERLVERAFATGARVSPVEGAATLLSEAAGIGAFLRW